MDGDGWEVKTYKKRVPSKKTFDQEAEKPLFIKRERVVKPRAPQVFDAKAEAKLSELHARGIIKREVERIKNYK